MSIFRGLFNTKPKPKTEPKPEVTISTSHDLWFQCGPLPTSQLDEIAQQNWNGIAVYDDGLVMKGGKDVILISGVGITMSGTIKHLV